MRKISLLPLFLLLFFFATPQSKAQTSCAQLQTQFNDLVKDIRVLAARFCELEGIAQQILDGNPPPGYDTVVPINMEQEQILRDIQSKIQQGQQLLMQMVAAGCEVDLVALSLELVSAGNTDCGG